MRKCDGNRWPAETKLISTKVEQGLMRVFCSDGDEPWGSCSAGMGKLFCGRAKWKKVKCQVGQLTFLLAILVNNNKPETQTRAARIAKQ
jgi:hypothetical protein